MASKKQQKAGFPLPNPIDGWPLLDICLKIPNAPEYRRAFIGHINQLGLWAIWEKSYEPGDTRARDAAQIWRRVLNDYLDMGCTDMNCCCDDPPAIYRFDADGNLERSTDGGTTWTPAPGFDPRQNGTLFPPVPDDDKCQAATNVKHHMKDKADQLAADSGAWAGISELIGAMIGILIFVGIIGSGGLLTPLMMALAGAILWTGQAAFSAAMTSDVYDTFKCIVYCHIQDDGSFTDDDITAIISDINSQLTGIAATYLSKTVQALGRVGMTNMARTGSGETGDCSECCPDCSVDWIEVPGAGIGLLVGRGEGYVDIQAQPVGGFWYATAYTGDKDICCKWNGYEVISGVVSDTNRLWKTCGSTDASTGPLFGDHCLWTVQFDSNAPFTVRMHFLPC